MSEQPDDDAERPSMTPFIGALAIVVLVVIGIFVVNKFFASDPTTDQLITQAVIGQNDALQRTDYQRFVKYTCSSAQGDEAGVMAGQRDSVAKHGERYVDAVTDVRVDGEQATAKVTYSFNNSRDDKKTSDVSLVGEDGAWKVCPR